MPPEAGVPTRFLRGLDFPREHLQQKGSSQQPPQSSPPLLAGSVSSRQQIVRLFFLSDIPVSYIPRRGVEFSSDKTASWGGDTFSPLLPVPPATVIPF